MTVEMTQDKKDNLLYMKEKGFSFVETVADIDQWELVSIKDEFWISLTEEQLMQAWLNPETIKVIEEKHD